MSQKRTYTRDNVALTSKQLIPGGGAEDLDNAVFTEDVELDISVAQIQKINAASPKHIGQFVQNLVLHLYGPEELRSRTVTAKNTITKKDKTLKPISPSKMDFIYKKALERAALDVGTTNFSEQQLMANKTLVNRAIAEKISNLRKAYKLSMAKTLSTAN
ncbi:uncharacterized protein LOC129758147 [Uranotaenia lowii]|uniref:uncharacterized protein LOC129756462 n=1 Tax=Uranotaenia lowii TaxID=190385 RepID=UPI00247AF38B|nr:uncharacterized protein LOC129756462 [Uranotaenia lowii]XP_055611587.1 uncharacterized protein LOC129758147 [Uranotaenia lowii]